MINVTQPSGTWSARQTIPMHRLTKTILAAGYFPENVQCVNIAVVDCWVIMQVIHLISDSLRCLSLDTMSIHRVNTRQDFVRMSLIFGNVSGLSGHLEKKAKKGVKSGYYGILLLYVSWQSGYFTISLMGLPCCNFAYIICNCSNCVQIILEHIRL